MGGGRRREDSDSTARIILTIIEKGAGFGLCSIEDVNISFGSLLSARLVDVDGERCCNVAVKGALYGPRLPSRASTGESLDSDILNANDPNFTSISQRVLGELTATYRDCLLVVALHHGYLLEISTLCKASLCLIFRYVASLPRKSERLLKEWWDIARSHQRSMKALLISFTKIGCSVQFGAL